MAKVYNVDVEDIVPEDWMPVDVIVVVKMLDDQGRQRMAHVYSDGISTWEALGMARAAELDLERQLLDAMGHED